MREDHDIECQDSVVTTSNKPLNFLQHIMTILDINGRAAVIVEDLTAALAGFEAVDAALDGSSAGS